MLEVLGVLGIVGNLIVVFSDQGVEGVLLSEDIISDPKSTVGLEHFTIKIVSNSATVLNIASHVLHSLE